MRWFDSDDGGGTLVVETTPALELEVIIDPWDGEAWGLWRLAATGDVIAMADSPDA